MSQLSLDKAQQLEKENQAARDLARMSRSIEKIREEIDDKASDFYRVLCFPVFSLYCFLASAAFNLLTNLNPTNHTLLLLQMSKQSKVQESNTQALR